MHFSDVGFADPADVWADVVGAFRPPPRITVAEWAERYRWLNNSGGGFVGRWQHSEAPWLVGPMEALTDHHFRSVLLAGPAQCGKTAVAENWLGWSIHLDPAKMLWFMQSDPAISAYVKDTINPMIDLHEETLKSRLGLRPVDDSLGFKRFAGDMTVQFLPAAQNNMISKRAPRLVLDEEDAYAENLGDAAGILDLRRATYGDSSKMLRMSHPDRAGGMAPSKWTAGIMRGYGASDRRLWYWPCPHCGAWSSPHPLGQRVMALHYDDKAPLDEIREQARLLCPTCGALIEDRDRKAMNNAALAAPFHGWIGEGQTIDEDGTVTGDMVRRPIAGFWIVGLMSTLVSGGIGALAHDLVEAQRARDRTGNDATLRQVVVKRWGLCYEPHATAEHLTGEAIADRAEPGLKLGQVPEGVRFLTAFVDVQGNRFELLVRGWGVGLESWVIDYRQLPAEPQTSAADWDRLLASLVSAAYPLADGSGRVMRLRAAGYDAYGAPGTTQHAYAAWRRWLRHGLMLRGRIDGREAWNVLPTKGLGGVNAAPLYVKRPDTQRRDRFVSASGAVPIGEFNANFFKGALASQLATAAGPFSIHFPAALRAETPPHLFFEGLVAEEEQPNRTWKHTSTYRNEPTDLMVGTHVIAHLHGLERIAWDHPPGWAAPWDVNTMVGSAVPGCVEPTSPAVAASPRPPPASPQRVVTPFPRGPQVGNGQVGPQRTGRRLA